MVDAKSVPHFTLNNGDTIPCLGMGTFGSDRVSPEEVAGAVAGGLREGYRLFDCAACYGNEDQIGKVFRAAFDEGIVERKDLYIMTKVWNDMHRDVAASCKKSIADLQCDYIDMLFIHWPFPNYHAPFCDVDSRNPDSKPFSVAEFLDTYRQIEELVDQGLVRHIGISNMTIPKLNAVLDKLRIKPAACESELHPCFQQVELVDYLVAHDILPIAYMPLGLSPPPGTRYPAGGSGGYADAGTGGNCKGAQLPSGHHLPEVVAAARPAADSLLRTQLQGQSGSHGYREADG